MESIYDTIKSNSASPQRAAEIYARTVSNCADIVMATSRIANNTLFANISAYKSFVQHQKDDVKEFSRIGVNAERTFENTSKDMARELDSRTVGTRYY